jgi:HK97 family phage prohead protease
MNRQFRGYGFLYESLYEPREGDDSPFDRRRSGFTRNPVLTAANMELRGHHYADEVFGSVSDGFLEAWLDPYGLAVSFDLPSDHPRASLMARDIYSHKLNGLSITFTPLRYHHAIEDGEEVVVVNQAILEEVSIVDSPRCWAARCWATDDLNLPSGLARLNEKWEQGQVEHARRNLEQTDREAISFINAARPLHPVCLPSTPTMPQHGRRGHASRVPPATSPVSWPEVNAKIDAILRNVGRCPT